MAYLPNLAVLLQMLCEEVCGQGIDMRKKRKEIGLSFGILHYLVTVIPILHYLVPLFAIHNHLHALFRQKIRYHDVVRRSVLLTAPL